MLGGVGFLAGRGCPGGPRGTGLVGWKGRQLALCPEWCPLGLYPAGQTSTQGQAVCSLPFSMLTFALSRHRALREG